MSEINQERISQILGSTFHTIPRPDFGGFSAMKTVAQMLSHRPNQPNPIVNPREEFEMAHKIGDRVGAIQSAEGDDVKFYGFGTYEGEHEPPVGPFGVTKEEYRETYRDVTGKDAPPFLNPRIRLDTGKAVWGMECWWGPAEVIEKKLDGKKITIVEPQLGE